MIYYWYKISTGEYMGHCESQPGTDEYSSTTTKPPAEEITFWLNGEVINANTQDFRRGGRSLTKSSTVSMKV